MVVQLAGLSTAAKSGMPGATVEKSCVLVALAALPIAAKLGMLAGSEGKDGDETLRSSQLAALSIAVMSWKALCADIFMSFYFFIPISGRPRGFPQPHEHYTCQ